jgi:hypothetical protein
MIVEGIDCHIKKLRNNLLVERISGFEDIESGGDDFESAMLA